MRRRVLLAAIFTVTGLAAFVLDRPVHYAPEVRLAEAVPSRIGAWEQEPVALAARVLEKLDVDDFINATFADGPRRVHLYVGQYYSNQKLGAAHSPLVCYPGQGWEISGHRNLRITVPGLGRTLNAGVVEARRGWERFLSVYWYQALDETFPDSFRQKLAAFGHRLAGGMERNSYVVISAPLARDGSNREAALAAIGDFIDLFYPLYLDFVLAG